MFANWFLKAFAAIVILVLFGLFYPVVNFLDDLQFILTPLILLLGVYWKSRNAEVFSFSYLDGLWLMFVVLCFVSTFYAHNSANSLSYAFFWLLCLLVGFTSRQFDPKSILKLTYKYGGLLFVLITLHILDLLMFKGLPSGGNWHANVGRNDNYLTCYLCFLLPLILFREFTKPKPGLYIKILAAVFTLSIIVLTRSLGVFIAYILLVLFYFFSSLKTRKAVKLTFQVGLLGISIVVLGVLFLPFGELFSELSISRQGSRVFMISRSIEFIRNNFLIGIGLGNWIHLAYDTDLSGIPPFDFPHEFIRHRNHILALTIFSELGVFGFLSHFLPILIIIGFRLKQLKTLSLGQKGMFISVIMYLLFSCFYVSVNLQEFTFNAINILAYFYIGILSNSLLESKLSNPSIKYVIASAIIVSLFWFGFKAYENHIYHKAKFYSKKQPELAISYLSDIYYPKVSIQRTYQDSYALLLANYNERIKDFEKAEYYYKEGLVTFPTDLKIKLAYSKFLFKVRQDWNHSLDLALASYKVQPTSALINIWLAELYIEKGNSEKSLYHIENIEKVKNMFGGRIYLRFARKLRSRVNKEIIDI